VTVLVLVDVVDHRRHRGGFSRAGGPGEKDESLLPECEVVQDRGELQLIDRRNSKRDETHHRTELSLLIEQVDSEPGTVLEGIRRVQLLVPLEPCELAVIKDRLNQVSQHVAADCRVVGEKKFPVNPHQGRSAHLKVQIGRVLLQHFPEKLKNLHGHCPSNSNYPTPSLLSASRDRL